MSLHSEKADAYFGPVAAAEGTDGKYSNVVIRRPTSTTNTSEALETDALNDGRTTVDWSGRYVNVQNEDLVNPVEFAFSVGAQTLVYGQTSTFTAGNAACGWRLMPGAMMSVIVPPGCTHANWIQPATATASTIAFYCSEGAVGGTR